MPDTNTRKTLIVALVSKTAHRLSASDLDRIARMTEGYSPSDITALAHEAAYGPIRGLGAAILDTPAENIRPITLQDFQEAMKNIRASVSPAAIDMFEEWNREKGVAGV